MKITCIETYSHGHIAFVHVITETGVDGWGQVSPYSADIAVRVLHEHVAPIALGADALDTETLSDRVIEGTYKFPGSYVCRALTGVDTALWDLKGKLADKPVCALLGGKVAPFPVYGSSMRRDITPEDEATRLHALREEFGYQAFKVRVGSVCGHDADQWPGRTEALLPAVRKAIDDAKLLVDGNSCYTPAKAIAVAYLLRDHGGVHFEEPCPYWELDWTAEVTRAGIVPVAGGEQDYDLQQWKRIIDQKVVNVVQPDICYIGGLTRALRVAKWAAMAGLPCVPHSANLSMVTLFTLHMMQAIELPGDYVEYSIEPTPWADGLFTPRLPVVDGQVTIPDGPGWGVEISSDWLDKADRMVSELD